MNALRLIAVLLALASLPLAGCSRAEPPRAENAGPADARSDLDRAEALLDAGEIPAAVEPLGRAAKSETETAPLSREEIDLLLTQAETASRPETAEARIAEMKEAAFEAYVERGELTRVPYFHDPRIDKYFRQVLLSKRSEAREIRTRLRAPQNRSR